MKTNYSKHDELAEINRSGMEEFSQEPENIMRRYENIWFKSSESDEILLDAMETINKQGLDGLMRRFEKEGILNDEILETTTNAGGYVTRSNDIGYELEQGGKKYQLVISYKGDKPFGEVVGMYLSRIVEVDISKGLKLGGNMKVIKINKDGE